MPVHTRDTTSSQQSWSSPSSAALPPISLQRSPVAEGGRKLRWALIRILLITALALLANSAVNARTPLVRTPDGGLTIAELPSAHGMLFADVQSWWVAQYPELAPDATFRPLAGGIFPYHGSAAPPCGDGLGDQVAAFYCSGSDFIAYHVETFERVALHYGSDAVGTIVAHEYGHAVRERLRQDGLAAPYNAADELAEEQAADCLAGAWFADWAERQNLTLAEQAKINGVFRVGRDSRGEPLNAGVTTNSAVIFRLGFDQGPQRCLDLGTDE